MAAYAQFAQTGGHLRCVAEALDFALVPSPTPLSARFYQRSPDLVARALLGKILTHKGQQARITECEAYLGPEDLASHARFGNKGRSKMLFAPGGTAYVYLCYGIHTMFNVVADVADVPGAVLIRAVHMLEKGAVPPERSNGPGKLTRALGIELSHNGIDMLRPQALYIHGGSGARRVPDDRVEVGPRIGIDYAGSWAAAPLRFVAKPVDSGHA